MKRKEFSQEEIDKIIKMYTEEYKGTPSICQEFNVCKAVINRTLKENGIQLGPSGRKWTGGREVAHKKWTSKLPYYHILPMPIYKAILKLAGESEDKINELVEIKECGITVERFERIAKASGFNIVNKQWFLINPIYKFKFGLKPRRQNWLFGAIPFVRNFLTTCAYYTIQKH